MLLDVAYQTSRTVAIPAAANGKKCLVHYNAEILQNNAGCKTTGKIVYNGVDIAVTEKAVATGVAITNTILQLQHLIPAVVTGQIVKVDVKDALSEQAQCIKASLILLMFK
jgi:hypothetical protein